jgi:hypothetical protein
MRANPEEYCFHADPEHLLQQLTKAYESDEFESESSFIEVQNALNVSDEASDDSNIIIDKFHLLEMMAFIKGTTALRES